MNSEMTMYAALNKLGPYWEQESAAIARNTVFAGVSALTLREDGKTRS